jgi:hypothetical protein
MEPKHILIKHRFRQRPLGRMDDEDIEFFHRKLIRGGLSGNEWYRWFRTDPNLYAKLIENG